MVLRSLTPIDNTSHLAALRAAGLTHAQFVGIILGLCGSDFVTGMPEGFVAPRLADVTRHSHSEAAAGADSPRHMPTGPVPRARRWIESILGDPRSLGIAHPSEAAPADREHLPAALSTEEQAALAAQVNQDLVVLRQWADFGELLDTDGDGLISFGEFILMLTLLECTLSHGCVSHHCVPLPVCVTLVLAGSRCFRSMARCGCARDHG